MPRLTVRSVSSQVVKWLGQEPSAGSVLAVHSRACNLVTGWREVISLVAPEIGDGPLNIVLGAWPGLLGSVRIGAQVTLGLDEIVLNAGSGAIELGLDGAVAWEPSPDWEDLRSRRAVIEASRMPLAALCLGHDPGNVLLSLLGAPSPDLGRAAMLVERIRVAVAKLEAGWRGDEGALVEGAAALAGLGDGLTPAGDDFLVGMMLWAWLAHPTPASFCRALAQAAAPRTTALSAAFLRAAARGQCGAAWHGLLAALAEGKAQEIKPAAQRVLAFGANSGLDALIGFLYLSWDKEDACRTKR